MDIKDLTSQYKGQGNLIKYKMPDDDINPELKNEMKYFVDCLKYLFALGCNGQLYGTSILNGAECQYSELRAYAKGRVNESKYKKELLGKDSNGNQRDKTLMNISWKQDTGHVKTFDQMRGVYEKMDFEMLVKAIDPGSAKKRRKEVEGLKIWLDDLFKSFVQSVGVQVSKPNAEGLDDEESIDIYVKSGGIKLEEEIVMKKAIDCTMSESKHRVLKMQWMDDAITLGIVGGKRYVDKMLNMPLVRYADPEYCLIPRSKYLDHRDITQAGELRCMTISDLRNESTLSEKNLSIIAYKYGFQGAYNADLIQAEFSKCGSFPYDHIKVWVLDGAWISSDLEKFTEKNIEKYGTLEYKQQPYDYKLPAEEEKRGKKLEEIRTQYTYEASWIIGTDIAFGYGRQDKQIKKGESGYRKAILPYCFCKTGTISKIERMSAYVDEINILTYKWRNAIACIPAPPGLIFNKSALENTEIDGQIKTPTELLTMLLEKGAVGLDTLDSHGNPIANINSLVASLQITGIFEQFKIFQDGKAEARRKIQLVSGINDMVDGTTDSERMLKIQGEAKLEAANNAMQPEYAMMRELMETLYSGVMLDWVEVAKDGKLSVEYKPLNDTDIEILELNDDISDVRFGLRVNIGSSYQEKQMLLQRINEYALERAKAGVGGIDESARLMLERIIMQGNMPLAQMLIAKAVRDQEKKDTARKQQDSQLNAQQQQQSAQVAEEEKRKSILLQTAMTMAIDHNKALCNAFVEAVKGDVKDGILDNEALRNTVLTVAEGFKPSMDQLQAYMSGMNGTQPQGQQQPGQQGDMSQQQNPQQQGQPMVAA